MDMTVRITNLLLLDRLKDLSKEYSVSSELLINLAIKKLIDDIDLLRDLRAGKIK